MKSWKNTLLAALVVANVALLAGVVLQTTPTKTALAQATGLNGNYLAVSGNIQNNFDALYLLDMQTTRLHVFVWDRGRKELDYVDSRSLERDFRNK